MPLPDFILGLPSLDIPFSEEVVSTRAIRSDQGLAVFFIFHQPVELPPHSHKGQWGTVVEGTLELTIAGKTHVYRPGESYDIPAGAVHSVKAPAGTIAFDVFEEPDRYPLKR
jgi:quercetin dioxygenase-like cupin family protein